MSTEADIVERLRAADMGWSGDAFCVGQDVAEEAADLITKLRAERDAAARDMRERCAKVADDFTGYSGEGSEGDNDLIGMFARGNRNAKRRIGNLIRALPDTPAVIATDGGTNG